MFYSVGFIQWVFSQWVFYSVGFIQWVLFSGFYSVGFISVGFVLYKGYTSETRLDYPRFVKIDPKSFILSMIQLKHSSPTSENRHYKLMYLVLFVICGPSVDLFYTRVIYFIPEFSLELNHFTAVCRQNFLNKLTLLPAGFQFVLVHQVQGLFTLFLQKLYYRKYIDADSFFSVFLNEPQLLKTSNCLN